jgi:hypothetical protein
VKATKIAIAKHHHRQKQHHQAHHHQNHPCQHHRHQYHHRHQGRDTRDSGDGEGAGARPRRKGGKQAEGTQAPNKFEADPVLKSRYNVEGRSLEVDPD